MTGKLKKSSANIDVAARAELKVEAKIPAKSSGRLIDALTDIIRPFTEARGLKADRIRLQREEVAIEIAKRARAKLAVQKLPISPVEAKVLVPLIEHSSNEELDDEYMLDKWAELLASASSGRQVEPRFVHILSELKGEQAEMLEQIALGEWIPDESDTTGVTPLDGIQFDIHPEDLKEFGWSSTPNNALKVMRALSGRGVVAFQHRASTGILPKDRQFTDEEGYRVDAEILESLRLLAHREFRWVGPSLVGSAPRRREPSVEEDSTRIIVDRSGSWRAARLGNWLGWSLATKAALGG